MVEIIIKNATSEQFGQALRGIELLNGLQIQTHAPRTLRLVSVHLTMRNELVTRHQFVVDAAESERTHNLEFPDD